MGLGYVGSGPGGEERLSFVSFSLIFYEDAAAESPGFGCRFAAHQNTYYDGVVALVKKPVTTGCGAAW